MVPEHDRPDAPVPPAILAGVNEQVRPLTGEIEDASATVLVKPVSEATVIVDVPVTPAFSGMLVGLATIVKSWTV